MDKTENSSRAVSQPPWASLTSVSLRQCKESNTLQNVAHKMCTLHMVSTRSLGHYAWGCISGILSPEITWDNGNDPSNLRLCDAGANNIGSAKQSISMKRDLKDLHHSTNACITKGIPRDPYCSIKSVTHYSLPGFWRFLLSCLNIFLGRSNIAETGKNAQCRAWSSLIRLVG